MADQSKIEWTDTTWNPLAGCTPVSSGCKNCYAANHARRLAGNPNLKVSGAYEGTARTAGDGRAVFTGRVNLLPDRLTQPLGWRRPRRVFVNAMSDLFHPDVPFGFVDRVFAVMALTPQHTYQVLTKRPDRMAEYLNDPDCKPGVDHQMFEEWHKPNVPPLPGWPLSNVWLGTSVEDQAAADERIPHLLRCPAAVRFLSCEPLLGPVVLKDFVVREQGRWASAIHWVIAGGESGPNARPCDVAWLRRLKHQCAAAGVPYFLKQLGANVPYGEGEPWASPAGIVMDPADPDSFSMVVLLRDRKGGDMAEWPEDLRIREFPAEVSHG